MKRWIDTGILTVLIIGTVFMSGCINPDTTGAAPEVTPATHIVNETVLITPAPSLTTQTPVPTTPDPVTTTPTPTPVPTTPDPVTTTPTPTPVPTTPDPVTTTPTPIPTVLPAATSSGNDESKYRDYNPVLESSFSEGGSGTLFIHTGGFGEDLQAYIVPSDGRNSGERQVRILPDGGSEGVSLASGNYIAYLPDKNGGPSEQLSFFIGPDSLTYISFSGYSYRASSGGGCGG